MMRKVLVFILVLLLLCGYISGEVQAGRTKRFIKRVKNGKLIGYEVKVKFKNAFDTTPSVVGSITSDKEYHYLTKSDVILKKVSRKRATFFIPSKKPLDKGYRFNWVAVAGENIENDVFRFKRRRGKCVSKDKMYTHDPVVVANVLSKQTKPVLTRMKMKGRKAKMYVKSRACPRKANFITLSSTEDIDDKLVGGNLRVKQQRRFKSIANNIGQRIVMSHVLEPLEEGEVATLSTAGALNQQSEHIIHVFADPHFSGTFGQFDWQQPGCWLYAEADGMVIEAETIKLQPHYVYTTHKAVMVKANDKNIIIGTNNNGPMSFVMNGMPVTLTTDGQALALIDGGEFKRINANQYRITNKFGAYIDLSRSGVEWNLYMRFPPNTPVHKGVGRRDWIERCELKTEVLCTYWCNSKEACVNNPVCASNCKNECCTTCKYKSEDCNLKHCKDCEEQCPDCNKRCDTEEKCKDDYCRKHCSEHCCTRCTDKDCTKHPFCANFCPNVCKTCVQHCNKTNPDCLSTFCVDNCNMHCCNFCKYKSKMCDTDNFCKTKCPEKCPNCPENCKTKDQCMTDFCQRRCKKECCSNHCKYKDPTDCKTPLCEKCQQQCPQCEKNCQTKEQCDTPFCKKHCKNSCCMNNCKYKHKEDCKHKFCLQNCPDQCPSCPTKCKDHKQCLSDYCKEHCKTYCCVGHCPYKSKSKCAAGFCKLNCPNHCPDCAKKCNTKDKCQTQFCLRHCKADCCKANCKGEECKHKFCAEHCHDECPDCDKRCKTPAQCRNEFCHTKCKDKCLAMMCKTEADCKYRWCKRKSPICKKGSGSGTGSGSAAATGSGSAATIDAMAAKDPKAAAQKGVTKIDVTASKTAKKSTKKKFTKKKRPKKRRKRPKTEWFELVLEDTETLATATPTPPQEIIHEVNDTGEIKKMDPTKAVGGMTHEQAKKLCEEKGVKPSRLEFCAFDVMALGPEKALELELKDQEVVEQQHEELKKIREREAAAGSGAKTLAMGLSRRRKRKSGKAIVVYVNTAKYKFKKTPVYVASVHSSEFFAGQAMIFSPSKTGFFMRLIRIKKSKSRVPLRIHWIAATP